MPGDAAQQVKFESLSSEQKQALVAYQQGKVSMSRLAQVMGKHVLELRDILPAYGAMQTNAFDEGDELES